MKTVIDYTNRRLLVRPGERGQAIAFFAVFTFAMALLSLAALDYMLASARAMETIGAADLAAHAGAMEIKLLPNGRILADEQAVAVAVDFFNRQRPSHASLTDVNCGEYDGRPGCQVEAITHSPGVFLPPRTLRIRAIGYLAYGIERDDQ